MDTSCGSTVRAYRIQGIVPDCARKSWHFKLTCRPLLFRYRSARFSFQRSGGPHSFSSRVNTEDSHDTGAEPQQELLTGRAALHRVDATNGRLESHLRTLKRFSVEIRTGLEDKGPEVPPHLHETSFRSAVFSLSESFLPIRFARSRFRERREL